MSAWNTKTIELKYPIEVQTGEQGSTEKFTEVVFATPKARQIREIGELIGQADSEPVSEIGLVLDCLAIITNLSPAAVDELHPADLMTLGEALGPFVQEAAAQFGLPLAGGSRTEAK